MHGLLLAVRGTMGGFSTTELGLLGTGWATGFVAGCILIPHIVRRVGHVRAYGALASVAAVTILLNLLMFTPLAWILLRAISGFTFAGASMIVESWLNERASRENRGTIFSIYQMVSFAASTAGQLLLAISAPSEYFYFVLGAIFYCLAILPTALSTAATPQAAEDDALRHQAPLCRCRRCRRSSASSSASPTAPSARSARSMPSASACPSTRSPSSPPARCSAARSSSFRWAGCRTAWTAAACWSPSASARWPSA